MKTTISAPARYPNGERVNTPRLVQEREAMSVVLAQPHRAWLLPAERRSQLAESPIGRLCLVGDLSRQQYRAAEEYRSRVLAMARHVWGKSPTGPTALDVDGIGGGSCAPELEDERIGRIRDNFREIEYSLMTHGLYQHMGACTKLIVMERYVSQDDLGDIRLCLNILARVWKIGVDE